MEQLKIGITHGYTNGVSYEVILKAFENPTMLELCTPVVYGSPKLATYHRKAMELSTNFSTIQNAGEAIKEKLNIIECFKEEVKVDLGQQTEEADKALVCSREAGLRDAEKGLINALVGAPGDKMEQSSELTVLINEFMKVAVLTDQIPLNQVAPFVTEENVMKKLRMFDRCLKRDFSLTRPRIAILALNPEPGNEEKEILEPLIQKIADEQICAIGPFTAEQFFASRAYTYYDGILAMYYDQCAAPLHLSGSEYCIALQTGENTIKTVPLQDASLDIAGRGEAPISSFCNAIYTALDVHRNRLRYEEAHKNPLPKLFHDKREDSRRDENKRPPKPE
ncbi:MAG: 4-hydroxythreonine-4-phosphate dehydrogenase PdxA [Bacteroidaceae bacterium]|nr:4-hydroxythreonine-4-phosphate dehydrogenase PdxA [Bacteroidaceae bacterium]